MRGKVDRGYGVCCECEVGVSVLLVGELCFVILLFSFCLRRAERRGCDGGEGERDFVRGGDMGLKFG